MTLSSSFEIGVGACSPFIFAPLWMILEQTPFDSSSVLLCSRFVMVKWDRILRFSLTGIIFLAEKSVDLPLGSSCELRLVSGVQQNGTLSTTLQDCNPWSWMAHQMPFDSI